MKVVVGLGNSGVQYLHTRHNSGLLLVDLLSQKLTSDYGWRKHYNSLIYKTADFVLVKPKDIFMNESGRLVSGFKFPVSSLYVAHDDLDLKLGEYKIQRGIGPKVHYGVQSVEGVLGTKDFWRIRIGIDNRTLNTEYRIPGEEYVLQKFTPGEKVILENTLDAIIKTINPNQESGR